MLVSTFIFSASPVKAQYYTATAQGSGGTYTIECIEEGTSTTGTSPQSLIYTYSHTLVFTVVPAGGQAFSYWSDGYTIYYDNPLTLPLSTTDLTLTAYFTTAGINTYDITASHDAYSTITPDGVTPVAQGSTQTYTWSASPGYYISQINVDGNVNINVNPPYAFTDIQGNHTISVYTEPIGTVNYQYIFQGPYYDDGALSSDTITATAYYVNGNPYTFSLKGPNAATTINAALPLTSITWNDSSSANYTRLISFPTTQPAIQNLRLFITDPNKPSTLYTFPLIIFTGITNAYLQVKTSVSGASYIIEQRNVSSTGSPSFVMQQYQTYTLSLTCDQGIYTQDFTAENIFSNNFILTSGSFISNTTAAPTASAARTSSTALTVKYLDPNATTTWLYVQITHLAGGNTIIDFTDNQTANTYTTTQTVDNATDYTVQIQTYRDGTITEWDIPCPVTSGSNPFAGLFNYLGTWPAGIDPAQIVAAVIIMLFLAIGSYGSAGVSCILSWIITGILMAIGWFTMGGPLFVFAGILSILVVLDESKKTAREA